MAGETREASRSCARQAIRLATERKRAPSRRTIPKPPPLAVVVYSKPTRQTWRVGYFIKHLDRQSCSSTMDSDILLGTQEIGYYVEQTIIAKILTVSLGKSGLLFSWH